MIRTVNRCSGFKSYALAKAQVLPSTHFSNYAFFFFYASENNEKKKAPKKMCMITLFLLPESPGWGWGRAATLSASSPGTWRAPWTPARRRWGWRRRRRTQRCCSWARTNRVKHQGEKATQSKGKQRPDAKDSVGIYRFTARRLYCSTQSLATLIIGR